jgi:Flp pilus assembly protein TadB
VKADQLSAIMTDYMALERARRWRRLFVARFGLLALLIAVAGAGLHWVSASPAWFSVGLCLAVPAWAWVVELRRDLRLARRLKEVPKNATHVVASPLEARKS